jgi:hypothetical protein
MTTQPVTPTSCSFLGLKEDPDSSLSFPSTGNFCYHCKPIAVPQFQQQENFCLSLSYTNCPVYKQAADQPLPADLAAEIKKSPGLTLNPKIILMLIIGAVLSVFLIWQGFVFFRTGQLDRRIFMQLSTEKTPTPTRAASEEVPSLTPTATIVAPTNTLLPTPTHLPTNTPLAPQKHALETPIQVEKDQFLIHLAMDGEGFDYLAKNYKTSVDVIRAINYKLPPTVWVNMPVVISPGLTVVNSAWPAFQAYKVLDAEITIDLLANKLNVDAALLKKYNACLDGCMLKENDWVIVPYSK